MSIEPKNVFLIRWICVQIVGRDAIQPFIVDHPNKIYEESNIDVDAMFSVTETVRITNMEFYSEKLVSN